MEKIAFRQSIFIIVILMFSNQLAHAHEPTIFRGRGSCGDHGARGMTLLQTTRRLTEQSTFSRSFQTSSVSDTELGLGRAQAQARPGLGLGLELFLLI
jgi:hypothetical protein